jgi:hypothetical protein
MSDYIVGILFIIINFAILYYITRYVYNPKKMIGKQGSLGSAGNQGRRGYQGPQGEEGNIGSRGGDGPRGDKGENAICVRSSDRCLNTIQDWGAGGATSHFARLKGGYLKPIKGNCTHGGGILSNGKCWRMGVCPFGYNLKCSDSTPSGADRNWNKNCSCSPKPHNGNLKIGSNNTPIELSCEMNMDELKSSYYTTNYNYWLNFLIKRGCPNVPNVI